MALAARAPWRVLEGFGGAQRAAARIAAPRDLEGLRRALHAAREERLTVTLRGAGRSYGDAALAAGGVALDMTGMNRVLAWDEAEGVATVEPGVTIEQLWRTILPHGFWPTVVPGTMFPTLGGCVAMNVHGKNAWRVGPIGDHVRALDLMTADGAVRTLSRTQEPELFRAAIGGAGWLGVVTRIEIEAKRVASGRLRVTPLRTRTLRGMFELFEARSGAADYLVGWVDAFARGPQLGRGLVHDARYLAAAEDPDGRAWLDPARQDLPPSVLGVPRSLAWRAMKPFSNDPGMRFVNALKWRLPERTGRDGSYLETHVAFAFLLDYVPGWRRAYDPRGFIQVQLFLPDAAARQGFERALTLCQQRGTVPYLAVFKRHREDEFLISHGLDGWSLALDFPVPPDRDRLWATARELTALTLDHGGRFYPAKDSVVDANSFARSLGDRLTRFLALRRTLDPDALFTTAQARRLLPGCD
ncbi:MAG TPA: FAD-binding oxidoreductase [Candidatus Eisenbacteria bacterium]|nr:FAD-binding oxidoreductase [Candidatus Eisenbacteria bacterium]